MNILPWCVAQHLQKGLCQKLWSSESPGENMHIQHASMDNISKYVWFDNQTRECCDWKKRTAARPTNTWNMWVLMTVLYNILAFHCEAACTYRCCFSYTKPHMEFDLPDRSFDESSRFQAVLSFLTGCNSSTFFGASSLYSTNESPFSKSTVFLINGRSSTGQLSFVTLCLFPLPCPGNTSSQLHWSKSELAGIKKKGFMNSLVVAPIA